MADDDVDVGALSDLCTPWCIHVVATLRIADHIAAGTHDIEGLARAADCDAASLQRVLRYLVEKGVFSERPDGHFELRPAARSLLDGARWLDLDGFGGRMAHAWGTLLDAVRTGRPAYQKAFGRPFWDDLEAHPTVAAEFDSLMSVAGHGVPSPNILINADWESVATVVDVGGGTGAQLAEIMRAHPTVRGILVDQPATVARASDVFRAAGVEDRASTVGQSFFDPLPSGADVYVVKNVLADWPDEEARVLLGRCAEAARPRGRVVIVGGVSPERARPELLMMVLVGGKDRSLSEFTALASEAGLSLRAAGHAAGHFVVECEPSKASD